MLWGCVLSAPLGVRWEREREGGGERWIDRERERERRQRREADDENWKLKKGGYEGLLALY